MKKIIIIFVAILGSCSSDVYVFTDHDKDFNVSGLKSYSWSEIKNIESSKNPIYYNELNDKRIKAIANQKLVSKGYKEIPENGDFVLHYHFVIDDAIAYREDPTFPHSAPWVRPGLPYYHYKEGTLIIDVMDLKSNSLIWRGYASQMLENVNTPLTEETINKSVSKILARFPAYRSTAIAKKK